MFHEVSSGALDDLEKATKQAYMMVSELGHERQNGQHQFLRLHGYSRHAAAKAIQRRNRQLIDQRCATSSGKRSTKRPAPLRRTKPNCTNWPTCLLRRETLGKEDLENILGKRGDNRPTAPLTAPSTPPFSAATRPPRCRRRVSGCRLRRGCI